MLEKVTAGEAVREVIDVLRTHADVGETLQAILARVRALMEASEAYIMLAADERLRLRAADGLPPSADGASLGVAEGVEGLAVGRGEVVTVPDAVHSPYFRDPFGRTEPVGAMAAAPLVPRGRVTGVIVATRRRPGQFGGSNLWWLEVLGSLAALAIEDDRIYRAQERRAKQAEILGEINAQSGAGAEAMLPRVASILARGLGVPYADLLLADTAGLALESCCLPAAGTDGRHASLDRLTLAEGGPLARVFATGQPAICRDTHLEPTICRLFDRNGVRSLAAVPIVVAGVRRGVLYLASDRQDSFSQDDLAFLSIVSARVGSLVETEDLRQRQLLLQRAEAEAQARQEFVGIVSHELKTPVAVIQAYTDLLLRRAERAGGANTDANTDVVRRIAEQAERMLALIEQLLELQRLEAGLFPLEVSRFDLVALVGRLLEGLQTTSPQHSLTLVADGPIAVSADRRRVEEVVQNLVDNAIKYSPEGGAIEITVRLDEGQGESKAVVAVRDHGQGIPAAEQPRVFERFYQGGDHLRRGHVGLGLGLHISREIVRRHGGEMWLESTPGVGSRFYFSLPASGPEED